MAMRVLAIFLLLTGAAGNGQRVLELRDELSELRAEMLSLRRVLEQEDEERGRRLAVSITPDQLQAQATRLQERNNQTLAAAAAAFQATGDADADLAAGLDSMWLLVCGSLVFFMHAGFAMLEAGTCRAKNASNVLMKNLLNVCIGSLAWYIMGYGFAYGGPYDEEGNLSNGFIGTKDGFAAGNFLSSPEDGSIEPAGQEKWVAQSPMLAWFFQWAFCQAAATIVSGGVAERVKSPTYAAYSFVMAGFIYPVVVAWTWGYGWLATVNSVGYMDFAGSGIVHLTGGVSALAGAVVLGPRKGRFDNPEAFEAHSLPLVVLGTLCLWFGWYAFNCGSTLSMASASTGALGAQVAMNTTVSAAVGGITVFLFRFRLTGKYDVCGLCNGILAGLVSITAGCGSMETGFALLTGLVGGIVYQLSSMLQQRLKIDDPVDASSVHGACGIWGVFACGLFDWGKGMDHYHGWSGFSCMTETEGGPCREGIVGAAMVAQVTLIFFIITWAGGLSLITFLLLKKSGLLRVDEEAEEMGMDMAHHSPQKAYALPDTPATTIGKALAPAELEEDWANCDNPREGDEVVL